MIKNRKGGTVVLTGKCLRVETYCYYRRGWDSCTKPGTCPSKVSQKEGVNMPDKVYVRDFKTRSVISEISVHYPPDSPNYDRFVMGLMRNMDLNFFFLDDDEYQKEAGKCQTK